MSFEQFTLFVNAELPKRISTNDNPVVLTAGKIPISTGVGLGVRFIDPNELSLPDDLGTPGIGLVTAQNVPLVNGTAPVPTHAYGGAFLNLVIVHLSDGSIVEVIGVTMENNTLYLPEQDVSELDNPVSVTFSYLGDLPVTQP